MLPNRWKPETKQDVSDFGFGTLCPCWRDRGKLLGRDDINRSIAADAAQAGGAYVIRYSPTDRDVERDYRGIVMRMKDLKLTAVTRSGYYFAGHAVGSPTKKELGLDESGKIVTTELDLGTIPGMANRQKNLPAPRQR